MGQTIAAIALSFVIAFAGVESSFAPGSAVAKKCIDISLQHVGTYNSGIFNQEGVEIVAHDPATQRVLAINAEAVTVDIIDMHDPSLPVKIASIDASLYGVRKNSVAVRDGVVAVVVAAEKPANGSVALFEIDGNFINLVTAGANPDILTFTPKGQRVLVANEGEPKDYCPFENDPECSVSIIDVRNGVESLSQSSLSFLSNDYI